MAVFTGNFHSEVLHYETAVRILLPDCLKEDFTENVGYIFKQRRIV